MCYPFYRVFFNKCITVLLTYSRGLQQKRDNAEEIHICIINSELNKDGPRVHIEPHIVEQIVEGAVDKD